MQTLPVVDCTYIPLMTTKKEDDGMEVDDVPPIQGYYCTCKSGARIRGSCAHIASILWYLEVARHENNVQYPPDVLIRTIREILKIT